MQRKFKQQKMTEIDTRFDFWPDYLAKSLNFTQKEGSNGQKPYTIVKLSSQRIFWASKFFQKWVALGMRGHEITIFKRR